ncbi:Xaa-Pro dipeptidase [Steroidobacter sp.]|uniref:Xaa-Pro dipeptidase n=1 Tax=Steroidobacter sp. TaxID=1978227 RepID=UPI001A4CBED7|nr:Xaa-Pro dipeptidase [Steroidobacter sp.]MBL8266483.1 Xaa-Pro dipeptidase [Steroidobacter sp.]
MTALKPLYAKHLEIQRRHTDEALAATGFDALAIYAGGQHMQFLDDQPYPFKPNPHFRWWTPLAEAADCWIVYRPGQRLQLVFLQPNDYWYKPPEMPSDFWTDSFDIKIIREAPEAKAFVSVVTRCAFVGEWREEFADWGFTGRNPEALMHRLHYVRAFKTEYELECMRRASQLSARAHKVAEAAFRGGASEYEINMAYIRATGQTENELPYPNIVALNANSAVLHYQNQERAVPAQLRSFLIDAGAQVHGYASDVTRTYSREDDDFAAMIRAMDVEQLGLCSEVRAGVDYADIHLSAHRRVAKILRDFDVISASAEEAATSGLSSVFFPHGIGHLLGLQVHDVAGFTVTPDGKQKARPTGHPYLRLTRTLEPGFVVTIEPGLYFIDSLLATARTSPLGSKINWQQVERFKPYGGIRVEDNVAATNGEPENLTRPAFAAATAAG